MIHEKNSRLSLDVQELFHPQDSPRILATILACLNMCLTVLDRGLRSYLVLDFGLAWLTSLSVLAFQQVYLTQIRDNNLFHTGLSVLV